MTNGLTKPLRDWRQFALFVAIGASLGVMIPLLIRFASPAIAGIVVAAGMIIAGWASCRFGGRLDEAMLEAVKWAWLWGGSAGIGVAMGVAVWGYGAFMTAGAGFALTPQTAGAIGFGAALVVGVQMIFHLCLWAYWWRAKR